MGTRNRAAVLNACAFGVYVAAVFTLAGILALATGCAG